jgi:hypothetical protein
MTDLAPSSLDEAAASLRAAWANLTEAHDEPSRDDDPEQDRRYITALWRVQGAEDNYIREKSRQFGA